MVLKYYEKHFTMELQIWRFSTFLNTIFLYKHNDYKHIEGEISLKTKHIISIFRGWKTKNEKKYKKRK